MAESRSLVIAVKEDFGPWQSGQLLREFQQLTDKDKEDLVKYYAEEGQEVILKKQ